MAREFGIVLFAECGSLVDHVRFNNVSNTFNVSFPPAENRPILQPTVDLDTLLMLDFQKGNNASFETLMHKYYPKVLNFIYRFVTSRESAEDLTQDVFIRVYKNRATYTPQAKFQTWIYTIAKNAALNELRRRKPLWSLDALVSTQDGAVARQVEDRKRRNPHEEVRQKEEQDAVLKAIAGLPESQRLAVILRRYDGFSYEEIAVTLNCSVPAVKSLLSRAKDNLRQALKSLVDPSLD